jgi:hypothetical protein
LQAIADGQLSFDEVTYQVGYEDSGSFRKVFLRQAGLRPITNGKLLLASQQYSRQISSPLVNSHQLFLHRHVTVVDALPWDDNIGYHVQTNNQDNLLSTDFGLKEFNPPSADKRLKGEEERIRRYRRYVYEAGALNRPEKGKIKVIGDRILEKERMREFELSRSDRFRYRTRYFTDSGVIGSKEFVSKTYRRFKDHFNSKHEKKPKPVKGLAGMYSLKRLSEFI